MTMNDLELIPIIAAGYLLGVFIRASIRTWLGSSTRLYHDEVLRLLRGMQR